MRSRKLLLPVFLVVAAAVVFTAAESYSQEKEEAPKYTYVGVKNCKMCHNKEATGAQFKIWSDATHAKAYGSLASEKSKAAAKKLGIEDPQKSEKCLKCHATAFAVMANLANEKVTMEEGVSCESCHGPGSGYNPLKTMKAITAGEAKPESAGLVIPTEKVCVACHNAEGNPFHKEFKFAEFAAKIAHPNPEKKK